MLVYIIYHICFNNAKAIFLYYPNTIIHTCLIVSKKGLSPLREDGGKTYTVLFLLTVCKYSGSRIHWKTMYLHYRQ